MSSRTTTSTPTHWQSLLGAALIGVLEACIATAVLAVTYMVTWGQILRHDPIYAAPIAGLAVAVYGCLSIFAAVADNWHVAHQSQGARGQVLLRPFPPPRR